MTFMCVQTNCMSLYALERSLATVRKDWATIAGKTIPGEGGGKQSRGGGGGGT